MVLCIKYRKKLLFDNGRIEFFKEVCSEIGKRYWFEFDALGTDGNHVHIFVGAAPKYAPSNVMQIIKSITAKNIFKKYPEIKNNYGGENFRVMEGILERLEMELQLTLLKRILISKVLK